MTQIHKLRCFCTRAPWLASYGIDEQNRVFVHVKIHKQSRIFGEVLVFGGEVKIHCRECLRWHRINFTDANRTLELVEDIPPPQLDQ